jgi:ComF family protein
MVVGRPNDPSSHRRNFNSFSRWIGAGLDLLFPIQCAGCKQSGAVWCDDCDGQLLRIRPPICHDCGLDLIADGQCPSCRQRKPALQIRSYARYTGRLVQALLALKYRPDQRLADRMGEWLAELLEREAWLPTVIIPVPLGARRKQQRGFNQAELLAEALARRVSIPHRSQELRRLRETRSQVGLDRWERWQNVAAAFQVQPDKLLGEAALLIDDLTTTGATMSACAEALRTAGVAHVWGLTVGRA